MKLRMDDWNAMIPYMMIVIYEWGCITQTYMKNDWIFDNSLDKNSIDLIEFKREKRTLVKRKLNFHI